MEPSNLAIIRDLGLPTALLAFILFGAWRASIWLGEAVIRPLVGRTMAFVDRLEIAVDGMSETLARVVEQQGKMVAEVEKISAIGCANYQNRGGNNGRPNP
jgi:hypothetical protein